MKRTHSLPYLGERDVKKRFGPWAAPAAVFSGNRWAEEWLKVLNLLGLPGTDFVLLASKADTTEMLPRFAKYSDFLSMQRTLCML